MIYKLISISLFILSSINKCQNENVSIKSIDSKNITISIDSNLVDKNTSNVEDTSSLISTDIKADYPYSLYFNEAYERYPNIPRGVLEAIGFINTRLNHRNNTNESCTGLPQTYGVMGLMLDGNGYFKNNLISISELSGISIENIKNNPKDNILAFASAYSSIKEKKGIITISPMNDVPIIIELSEIPSIVGESDYPLNSHVYSVLKFLSETDNQIKYKFPNWKIDFIQVFGKINYEILSSPFLKRQGNTYVNENGTKYINNYNK